MNDSRPKFYVPGLKATAGLILMTMALSVAMITESHAGPSCTKNPDHPKCGGGDGGDDGSGKVYAVRVTFDDADGDTIQSDDDLVGVDYYISDSGAYPDSGVGARLPVEFSPPGQFVMTTRLGGNRTLFFDFGEVVDCTSPFASGTGDCVWDKDDDETFLTPVPCLFSLGDRFDDEGDPANEQCSGYKQVVMGFRHSVESDSGDQIEYMLGMENNETFDGKAGGAEFDFREESNRDDDLRLRFDNNCLGENKGDFLKITAWDEEVGGLPNDHWKIDTIETVVDKDDKEVIVSTTKEACLTKKGNGKREDLVGLFDMQFGYTICILADQDGSDSEVEDDACFVPNHPDQ